MSLPAGTIDTRTEAVNLALRTEGVDANNLITVATEINDFIVNGSTSAASSLDD